MDALEPNLNSSVFAPIVSLSLLQILVASLLFTAGVFGKKLLVPESILEKEICSSLGVQGHELTEELVAEKLVSLELNDADLRDLHWP